MYARAFSLVEVIIAVGILAGAALGILGLLPQLMRQSARNAEGAVAQRLPAAVRVELRRSAGTNIGALAAGLPVLGASAEGYRLLASRDGAQVVAESATPWQGHPADAFFLIEVWRFAEGPLSFAGGASAVLAVHVRVSWPYQSGTPAVTTGLKDRLQWSFTTTIAR